MSDKSTQKRPLETTLLKTSFPRGEIVFVGALLPRDRGKDGVYHANMIHRRSLFAAAPRRNGRSKRPYR